MISLWNIIIELLLDVTDASSAETLNSRSSISSVLRLMLSWWSPSVATFKPAIVNNAPARSAPWKIINDNKETWKPNLIPYDIWQILNFFITQHILTDVRDIIYVAIVANAVFIPEATPCFVFTLVFHSNLPYFVIFFQFRFFQLGLRCLMISMIDGLFWFLRLSLRASL